MDIAQSLLIALTTIVMVIALVLSFIPMLPGPMLVWGVVIIFGVLNGFQRLTPAAAVAASVLMIAGVTSDLWLSIFGVKTGGLTCLASIGSLIGGLVATFIIPIPIVNTLLGCVAGALLTELIRFREIRKALQAGQSAATMFVVSYIVEVAMSAAIFVVYVVSLLTTA